MHQKEVHQIQQNANSELHFQKLQAAFYTKKLWPNNARIKIGFVGDGANITRTPLLAVQDSRGKNGQALQMDPLQNTVGNLSVTDAVKKIVTDRIQPIVDLQLEFVADPKQANVRISFDPNGGAWSLVGTDCLHEPSKPTMNLGWFDVATTIHEFGHVLGMVHEHQNPKGNPIEWNKPKVYAWASSTQEWDQQTTQTNIINRYKFNQINGSSFDPLSIMLYFFPASLTLDNQGTHENLRLSGEDVVYLNKMYPGSKTDPTTFYQQTYQESLGSSLRQSKQEAEAQGGGGSANIYLLVLLGVVFVAVGLFLFKRYKFSTLR